MSEPGKGTVLTVHLVGNSIKVAMVPAETCDPMPGLGQERTSRVHLAMSALPPKADIGPMYKLYEKTPRNSVGEKPAKRAILGAEFSLKDLVAFLSELHALGIDLFLHQQGLDTTTPAGKAMFQMLGVFAEFERSIIQERVRAGLQRAGHRSRTNWLSGSGRLWRRV